MADHTAEDLRSFTKLHEKIKELEGVILQHGLCHDPHSKVNAADFAAGCAAEQRKLYGCAPDSDTVDKLIDIIELMIVADHTRDTNAFTDAIRQFYETIGISKPQRKL